MKINIDSILPPAPSERPATEKKLVPAKLLRKCFPEHPPTPAYYGRWRVYHEEKLATFFYNDGMTYDFCAAAEYVTQHYRYLSDYMHDLFQDDIVALKRLLVALLRRSNDYCTICRVHCTAKTHLCHECLTLAPLFSAPSACTCKYSRCFFSRPLPHARLLYSQKK